MFEQGVNTLKRLGVNVVYKDPFQKWRYLAGQDHHRRAEFLDAMMDPGCRGIFFARGGYGCSRMLDKGFEEKFSPKILLGCSDITTLHLYFQEVHSWVVFYGPMASGDFARGQVHVDSFLHALTASKPYKLQPDGIETLIPGTAEGTLKGGCLSLIDAAAGTSWEPDWSECIVFLEDVSTKPYQIDRMLTRMKLTGKLDGVRAFIFGEMKDCIQVENQGYTLQEVIFDVLGQLGKPIYFNFPSGHVSGLNWTLPFGVRASVSGNPFRLEILEGAVE
jgi:muramoyltetrapeptide carboxypeptidase